MTYGLSPRAFIDGRAKQVMKVQSARSTPCSWRALDPEARLAAIELALKPANDLIDAFPMAL